MANSYKEERISLYGGIGATTVDEIVAEAASAREFGFNGMWLTQSAGLDALTTLAIVGRAVPNLDLGTAVVAIQGRHPIPLAQQALTVADAIGPGRLTVGLGVKHAEHSVGWFGVPYEGIVALCEEHVLAMRSQLKARHLRYLDTHEYDRLREVFTPDVVIDLTRHFLAERGEVTAPPVRPGDVAEGQGVVVGRETFIASLKENLPDAVTVHHAHQPEIAIISDTTATGIMAMEDYIYFADGGVLHGAGYFHETYKKVDGSWLIDTLILSRLYVGGEFQSKSEATKFE